MATDYDTPRKTDEELHEESLEELKARRADAQSGQVDIDEAEAAENLANSFIGILLLIFKYFLSLSTSTAINASGAKT